MIAIILASVSIVFNVIAFIFIFKLIKSLLIVAKDIDETRVNLTTLFKKLKNIKI